MKKQAIFILDPKTEKLIGVCDIKSLTVEQFINFQNESKRNLVDKLQLENFVEQEKTREFNNKILELQNEINDLKAVLLHVLGVKELSQEELERILYCESEEPQNEQN